MSRTGARKHASRREAMIDAGLSYAHCVIWFSLLDVRMIHNVVKLQYNPLFFLCQ
jgi:hypothetical protein